VKSGEYDFEFLALQLLHNLHDCINGGASLLGGEDLLQQGVGAGGCLLQIFHHIPKRLLRERLESVRGFGHSFGGIRPKVLPEGVAQMSQHPGQFVSRHSRILSRNS